MQSCPVRQNSGRRAARGADPAGEDTPDCGDGCTDRTQHGPPSAHREHKLLLSCQRNPHEAFDFPQGKFIQTEVGEGNRHWLSFHRGPDHRTEGDEPAGCPWASELRGLGDSSLYPPSRPPELPWGLGIQTPAGTIPPQ